MSASAPDVIGTGAAEPRRDDKDSPGILNRDAAALQDRAVVPQPVEVAQVELPNVGEPLDRHDESLEAEAPGQDRRIDPEGDRHLRPEDAAPSELQPAAVGGLAFRLHARLRVGKVTGPELHAGEAEPLVERLDRADQLGEVRALFHHHAFDLVEFRQMFPVRGVGPEVPADDERLLRRLRVLHEPLQRDRRRVRAEDGPLGFLAIPLVPPSGAARPASVLMGLRDLAQGRLVRKAEGRRLGQVERVELVARRMVLRLEQGVEVPERGLDEVPIDLRESHAQEDPTILSMYAPRTCRFPGRTRGANAFVSYRRKSTCCHFPDRRSSVVGCATSSFKVRPAARILSPAGVRAISRRTDSRSFTSSRRDFKSRKTCGSIAFSGSSPFASRASRSSSGPFDPAASRPSGVTETTLPSGPFATSAQPLRRSHPRATASSPSSNLQAAWSLGTDILPPALINARRAFRSGSALRATAGVASRKEWTTRSFIVTRPFACSHDAAFITSTSSRNFPAAFSSSGEAFLSLPSV